MSEQFIEVYISSGRKNALYTLRVLRSGGGFHSDHYVRSLCRDPDKAETMARDYYDRVFGDQKNVAFAGYASHDLSAWGAPEPWEREAIEAVERGIIPFGKHKGEMIADQDDGYVLWWSEQEITAETGKGAVALIERMMGLAVERDLIAKREKRQAEYEAQKANSQHVGTEGERQRFTAKVEAISIFQNQYTEDRCIQRLRSGDDLIVYWGFADLGDKGDTVSFDARVKRHADYKGENQTIVNRPTKIEIEGK